MTDKVDTPAGRVTPHLGWRHRAARQLGLDVAEPFLRSYASILIAMLAAAIAVLLTDSGFSHLAVLAIVAAFLLILYLTPLRSAGQAAVEPKHRLQPIGAELPLLRELVNGMPEAALMLSPDGLVLHRNERALAYCPTVQRGRHISTCIRDPRFLDAVAAAPQSNAPVSVQVLRRIPVEQRIDASIAAIRNGDGSTPIAFILVTLRDLSEQETLARMRADFIANASHELRTPLASLQGFIETLQGPARNDPAAREKFLNIMAEQSKRMTRLIDDLLSLSRVEMKAHLFPEGRVEMGALVGHVIDTLEPLAAGRDISLRYAEPATPLYVRGDRDELVQVFQNLIHNAIKYGREGGHVEVTHRIAANGGSNGAQRVQIAVRDDGPGIAPEHLPRLVERFYRVDVADSRQKGGTGLGLAIVKHVLNRHRGELKIASELGKGATFTVELPLLAETVALPAA